MNSKQSDIDKNKALQATDALPHSTNSYSDPISALTSDDSITNPTAYTTTSPSLSSPVPRVYAVPSGLSASLTEASQLINQKQAELEQLSQLISQKQIELNEARGELRGLVKYLGKDLGFDSSEKSQFILSPDNTTLIEQIKT